MTTQEVTAYHFTGDRLRDGRQIPKIGEWLLYHGEVIPCQAGLHASIHPFDALQYSPGNFIHLVKIRGEIKSHGNPEDKIVGRERMILKSFNAEKLLRDFARWSALQVLHLCPNTPEVVVKFLKTGDESIRSAARDAAWDAARAAARDAARAAARAAARDAARDAARAAARAAAWAAAWAAARAAARDEFIKKAREEFKSLIDSEFKKIK
jgi:hypothetical protein